METQIVYIALDDTRLTALAIESEASGISVEARIREAISEFLNQRRER